MMDGRARKHGRSGGWAMGARAITALFGGYAAAAGVATLAARLLPIARVEATIWSMILSFLLFAAIGLWSFYEARLVRVAATVWGIAAFSIGTAWLLGIRP
jgi:hypothetical protein